VRTVFVDWHDGFLSYDGSESLIVIALRISYRHAILESGETVRIFWMVLPFLFYNAPTLGRRVIGLTRNKAQKF
jgi:hypothetical protein